MQNRCTFECLEAMLVSLPNLPELKVLEMPIRGATDLRLRKERTYSVKV